MGNYYVKPERDGNSPYTRSGVPPPPTLRKSGSDKPNHLIHDTMSLELHMHDERARTVGLTQAEREWRLKWLKDQHLHPDEPIHVDAVHRQLNPLRVLYRWPWDALYKHFLRPTYGVHYGMVYRNYIPKILIGMSVIWIVYYQLKYAEENWQRVRGMRARPFNMEQTFYEEAEARWPGVHDLAIRGSQCGFVNPEFSKRLTHCGPSLGETSRPW